MRPAGVLLLALLAACRGTPDSAPPRLDGDYQWRSLDGQPPPVVFPVGSGMTLLDGALELALPDSATTRFGMRFTFRQGSSDSTTTSGERGRFTLRGDSLLFVPDGREDRPPVVFTFRWASDGALELIDGQGHVWRYTRREAPGG
jgi:hypothetical protein